MSANPVERPTSISNRPSPNGSRGNNAAGHRLSARQRIERFFGWLALVTLQGVLRCLPPRTAVALGALLGRAAHLMRIRRRVVLENLASAFPDWPPERRRRIARQAYRQTGRMLVECLLLPSLSPDVLDAMVEGIDGEENLTQVGATGKPFVVVTAHVDNWELMGAYFVRQGYRLQVIAKPLHNPRVEAALVAARRAVGLGVLYTGEGMKPGLRHLRGGGVLAILADQDARKSGIAVPFFDRPASTALGPAVFAWLARVPLLPVFACRVGPMRHRFRFFPPIEPAPGEERDAALERMTHEHVKALESFVREHPEDYFWFHRRWKTPARKLERRVR